jgi:D-tagatose-1,6-bisphosphate aldolase subunit GatZ/KbaZ
MKPLDQLVDVLIDLRQSDRAQITLLAVCPNSAAVLEAAVKAAALNRAPMLLAATLNQVDRDGGYTGWTPRQFVDQLHAYAEKYAWQGPLYPCLDHGGPWLKDRHTLDRLTYPETLAEVKESLRACLSAGYQLLHIDPTVDRDLPPGQLPDILTVVDRTLDLIAFAEAERLHLGLPPVAYEVGTEEVHGGLVNFAAFRRFLESLHAGLASLGLERAWPCFVVARVGTDLHTTDFSPEVASQLYSLVAPLGSLIKGHYTDWVANPAAYPQTGMGGANVGPEFTAAEYLALQDLAAKEQDLLRGHPGLSISNFMAVLEGAVVVSGRWQKWLSPGERGLEFTGLSPARRAWLAQTGARYIWTDPAVVAARQLLYRNLEAVLPDPHGYVVDRIVQAIDRYIVAFHLFDSLALLS